MRLGIDLTSYNPESTDGVSTFCFGLIEGFLENLSIDQTLTILVSSKNITFFKKIYKHKVIFVEVNYFNFEKILNRFVWLLSWFIRNYEIRYWLDKYLRVGKKKLIERNVDALIVPTTVFNFFSLDIPTILCIHDIQQEYFPENFTFNQKVLRWASYRLSCKKASLIQASSFYIKKCLTEKFTFINPEKIFIASEGVNFSKFSTVNLRVKDEKFKLINDGEFIFYPAQIWPHKNHLLLIKALAEFRDIAGIELPCILTGFDYGYWWRIQELINQYSLNKIYYFGRVSFEELTWLYANTKAVLALGIHESSSLPVREGSVFGRPIICVDIPPNIEVAAHLNIQLVDQSDPRILAQAFINLDVRVDELRLHALKNIELVKKFDWSIIALKYLEALKKIKKN